MTIKEMTERYIEQMEQTKKLGEIILRMKGIEENKYEGIELEIENMNEHLSISIDMLKVELM